MNRVRLAPQTRLRLVRQRRIRLMRPGNNGPSAREGRRTAYPENKARERPGEFDIEQALDRAFSGKQTSPAHAPRQKNSALAFPLI